MKNTFKLSLMMFLQYMMLPVWFVPMLPYVNSLDGGSQWMLWCGLIMGFGTLFIGYFLFLCFSFTASA